MGGGHVDWALVAVPVTWVLWHGCQALGCEVGLNEWAVGVWGGCRALGCEVRLNEWVGVIFEWAVGIWGGC